MHLQTDSINRNAAVPQPFHQLVDRLRFGIHTFGSLVVVKQLRIRVGLMRPLECQGDVFRPDAAQPDGILQIALRVERFVDYIPGVDLTPVATNHCGYMLP